MNTQEFHREKNFLETSPDKILDGIKNKINLDNLEEWQIGEIVGILNKGDVNPAVGKMSEIFDLDEKELNHLRELPIEVVKKIFVKEKIEEAENEEN